MIEERRGSPQSVFFSVCIPQYNRTSFLLEALRSLESQTFRGFEVCISDDNSLDGREREILGFLGNSSLNFVYRKQKKNTGYDGNLRASLELAQGRYSFLLGNDDALAFSSVLAEMADQIRRFGNPGVVITNYREELTGREFRRVCRTGLIGAGPWTAAKNFRNLSFVGGLALDVSKAKEHATERWDGSEMYQTFIGCRIIAEGKTLLGIDRVMVRAGIQLPGEKVESYASKPRIRSCPVIERPMPLNELGRLVVDAVSPYVPEQAKQLLAVNIFSQLFLFTYPFWIAEYRQGQTWRYSMGICIAMRPRRILGDIKLGWKGRITLSSLYALVTLGGLLVPVRLFQLFQPFLYRLAKRQKREE